MTGRMRYPIGTIAIAAIALWGWGCATGSAERTEPSWQATVDTVGDTIVVHTTGGSVWGDTMGLTPELTIGVLDGADEYMFGNIQAFALGPAGNVYVLDRQVPVLREYDATGTYVRDIGREGGGPGEYERPASLAILPDGRMLVRDPGNGRINVYDAEGTSFTSWRLPSGGTFNTSRPLYIDRSGNSYTMVLLEAGQTPWRWRRGLAHFTAEGNLADTLPVPTWDYEQQIVTAEREGSSSSSSVPYTPQVLWTFSPLGYFVAGLSDSYRIDLFRVDQPRLRIERNWEAVPVLSDERAEREHSIIENFKRNYGSWRWNGPHIPDTKPPFNDITVDSEGRIWVRVSQRGYAYRSAQEAQEEEGRTGRPQRRFREHVVFDVFEPTGRFLGTVRAPDEFQTYPAIVTSGDTVWATTEDELGVARLVRFRLTPATAE